MAFNISLASTTVTELESYEWFTSTGISLKNVNTYLWGPTDPSGWTCISDYVKSIRINGSVTNVSGEPGANEAFIELDNLDKRFTDINATGPYYGVLNPNQLMKITLSVGAESVTIFSGRVSQNGFVEDRIGHAGNATVNIFDDAYAFMRKKFDKDYFYENKKLIDAADAGNSLLHILLQEHASMLSADIVTNGAVDMTVPYTVFREGASYQDILREIATATLAQYAGFRHDGKYVFESRLTAGWSEPSAEYVLTTESYNVDLTKEIAALIGNNVKVRGVNDFSRDGLILWDLSKIKQIGVNASYPNDLWEIVGSGEFYLGTPVEPRTVEYTTMLGELLKASSLALNVKTRTALSSPHWNSSSLTTVGTVLEENATSGSLVFQNSLIINVYVMGMKITGRGIIRRNLGNNPIVNNMQVGGTGSNYHLALPTGTGGSWEGDDLNWGRIGVASNASSISMYGQTDLVISSEMICGNTQLDNILQWHLLNGKDPKHVFSMGNLPFLAFMQPGAPVWVNLTDLGFSGMVTVQSFEHNITPDTADTTLYMLENPGDWTVSTGATVREVYAAGSGGTGPGELGAPNWGGNNRFVIATAGCSLPADIFCDGTSDQSEWNDAIQFVSGRGGGTIVGVGSIFNTTATVSLESNIAIELDSGSSIKKNGNFNAIEALGTATTAMSAIAIVGGGKITRDAGDTNATDLVHFENVEDFLIANVGIIGGYDDGIYIQGGTNGEVGGGVNIDGCAGTGLKVIAGATIIASSLAIMSCAIGCEMWPSLTTNKISNGDCETTDEPMLNNESVPYSGSCAWARTSSAAYSGTYAYKFTAQDLFPYVWFQDNVDLDDMHGLSPGKSYLLDMMVWWPSGQDMDVDVLQIYFSYYASAMSYVIATTYAKPIYNQWQRIRTMINVGDDATGIYLGLVPTGSYCGSGEYIYVDDISLYEFDATDSGCQLVNSSIEECADGVIVANSHALIQNNQVTGCKSTGITIAAGYRNIVSGNRAYNNGDDTGLSNENQHNFYDAGIDTQIG
ncbi:MAG: right-handed parallel beta-helix repeat-containing protein [Candidatus Omnitrophica bacterium]|nr:right-handed parallel beta-helix repeat-containing protein [Candidatus Omnitrophota bacterium]